MRKAKKNNKKEVKKICKLCKADFEIKLQTIDASPEKEEKMRNYFSHYCKICKCPPVCDVA